MNGEIITKGPKTPKDAFLAFKVSKQHNETMLDRDFLTFGSGYYVAENGKSYWIILLAHLLNRKRKENNKPQNPRAKTARGFITF